MAMRPLFAGSMLGISLILSSGCSTSTSTDTPGNTTQATPQPTQTVAITDEKQPEEQPTTAAKPDAPQPMKRPEVARITKDPFVNPFTSKNTPSVPTHRDNKTPEPGGQTAGPAARATAGGEVAQVEKGEIPPPEFEVRGLVKSNGHMLALLSVEDKTNIVRSGQAVGDYRIASIDSRGVTVTRSGQKFRVKMKNEFGL